MSYPANEQIVRQLVAACNAKRYKNLREYFTDDIAYHVPGLHPYAGNHTGFDAVVRRLAREQYHQQHYPLTTTLLDTASSVTFVAVTACNETTLNDKALSWNLKALYFFQASLIFACWLFVDNRNDYDSYWSAPLTSAAKKVEHKEPSNYSHLINSSLLAVGY